MDLAGREGLLQSAQQVGHDRWFLGVPGATAHLRPRTDVGLPLAGIDPAGLRHEGVCAGPRGLPLRLGLRRSALQRESMQDQGLSKRLDLMEEAAWVWDPLAMILQSARESFGALPAHPGGRRLRAPLARECSKARRPGLGRGTGGHLPGDAVPADLSPQSKALEVS
jgi:hypothetical protein